MPARYQNLLLGSEYEAISRAIGLAGRGNLHNAGLSAAARSASRSTKDQDPIREDDRLLEIQDPHVGTRCCELYGKRSEGRHYFPSVASLTAARVAAWLKSWRGTGLAPGATAFRPLWGPGVRVPSVRTQASFGRAPQMGHLKRMESSIETVSSCLALRKIEPSNFVIGRHSRRYRLIP